MGSDGFRGTPVMLGSLDMTVNRIPSARMGDMYAGHGPFQHASRYAMLGSLSVACNRLPIHRSLDPISCGDMAGLGSLDAGSGD